jgi:1-acyl-sn-glycerol-3-phosphate acyltransferase
MGLAFWTVNKTIKGLTRLLCRVDDEPLAVVPMHGPLILVCNHINFIDIPLIFTHLQPRPLTGLVKSETWDSPWLGPLFTLWGAIPLKRGEPDATAMRMGLRALQAEKIVAIAPEGTRSGDGQLRRAHPGVVTLALRSGAPILPLVYFGQESFHQNLRRMRRTDFHIAVGKPFKVEIPAGQATRAVRQAIADEIMCQLAALMPPPYRGVYAHVPPIPAYLSFCA